MDDTFQFDDDTLSSDPTKAPATQSASSGGSRGDRTYAQEVFTKTIQAKFRTFYVDLKKSSNGYFVKISEKSHGRKSTIMMDMEDVTPMIESLKEVQAAAK